MDNHLTLIRKRRNHFHQGLFFLIALFLIILLLNFQIIQLISEQQKWIAIQNQSIHDNNDSKYNESVIRIQDINEEIIQIAYGIISLSSVWFFLLLLILKSLSNEIQYLHINEFTTSESLMCSGCGGKISDKDEFCTYCGKNIDKQKFTSENQKNE